MAKTLRRGSVGLKSTPPVARLKALLSDATSDDFPDPDVFVMEYEIDLRPVDYAVPFAMVNNEYSYGHIAFLATGGDWTATEDSITLTDPQMAMTAFGIWLYRTCTQASEKTYQLALSEWHRSGHVFDVSLVPS